MNHDLEKAAKNTHRSGKLKREEEERKEKKKILLIKNRIKFYRIVCWKEQVWE